MNQKQSPIVDEISERVKKLVQNTGGHLKNKCIAYAANTYLRIHMTFQIENGPLQYFLLSFILASTRTWDQFYNKKQGLKDFKVPSKLKEIESLQQSMFDSPPDIIDQPIDLQPMKEILYENIEILSVICQRKIVTNDIDKFMKFNKVLFYKFKEEQSENQAARLFGLSTFDGEITYINFCRKGKDLIETYLKEFCHNFYRFMLQNNQSGCLNQNNKSLSILKSEVEIRQQYVDRGKLQEQLDRKVIKYEDYLKQKNQIDSRIITQDHSLVYVESGDYFDFHVLKKAIKVDPYSLLRY